METKKGKILIVDDNQSVLDILDLLLRPVFEYVKTTDNPDSIISLLKMEVFDLVLLDMNFTSGASSGKEGFYWLKRIMKFDPSLVVILITAYGDVEQAVTAMKEGAIDFVLKPWDNKKLISTLNAGLRLRESKLEIIKLRNKQIHLNEDINKNFTRIIGDSAPMKKLFATIAKVAKTDANVLLCGENGTGKELVAREIHRLSSRYNEVMISVDMSSLSESLFESELFGNVKGAFTDAKESRAGRFETASGGTLFLDEIANISMSAQSKILTVLQNREIFRLGSINSIPIDIRLICATNKNIDSMIKEGVFREDLYYRINTIKIELPPLRNRGDDIILLAEYFLDQYSKKYDKSGLKISSKAFEKLKRNSWKGNVRELDHAMEKAVILCESNILGPEDFYLDFIDRGINKIDKSRSLEETEKIRIIEALDNNQGHLNDTADELKIARQTLYRKIKKYKI
ncbi:sigma-54-dependent transcriptional regulator [Bacteroidota bacterium]